jgi:hypothetical protein
MDIIEETKRNRLLDIRRIEFGDNLIEITSALSIILTLYENDDDAEIIGACKLKVTEGIQLLEKIGAVIEASKYKIP